MGKRPRKIRTPPTDAIVAYSGEDDEGFKLKAGTYYCTNCGSTLLEEALKAHAKERHNTVDIIFRR